MIEINDYRIFSADIKGIWVFTLPQWYTHRPQLSCKSSLIGTYLPSVVQLANILIDPIYNLSAIQGYTVEQCLSYCATTVGCIGFSIQCSDGVLCYGSESISNYTCYLKSYLGTASMVANYTAVAYVLIHFSEDPIFVPIGGVDFAGNDFTPNGIRGTYDQCAEACLSLSGCGMIIIHIVSTLTGFSSETCYLKSVANIGWDFNDVFQSYVLPKTTVSGIALMNQCYPCTAGQSSFSGSSGCYLLSINNGQPFILQNGFTGQYLNATCVDPSQGVVSNDTVATPSLVFVYYSSSLQIYSPSLNLCMDDLGLGHSSVSSTNDTLAFRPCTSSITQQFVYIPQYQHIQNPNNPNNKCLDGKLGFMYWWQCDDSSVAGSVNSQRWSIHASCLHGFPCSPSEAQTSSPSGPTHLPTGLPTSVPTTFEAHYNEVALLVLQVY